jgi:hypothetical protein
MGVNPMPPFSKPDTGNTAVATTKTSKTKAAADTGATETTQEGINSGAQGDASGTQGATPTDAELAAQKAAEEAAAREAAEKAEAEARAQAEAEANAKAEADRRAAEEAAAKAALEAEADAAAKAAALTFPRSMRVVNDTAQPWVVRKFVPPSSSVEIDVRDDDDLHNLRHNARAVLLISDHYRPEEGKPDALRIVELDDEQA